MKLIREQPIFEEKPELVPGVSVCPFVCVCVYINAWSVCLHALITAGFLVHSAVY